MKPSFYKLIEENPVIAAVKDNAGLETCCACEDIRVIFILYGDICSIDQIITKAKNAGKIVMVHIDLLEGLGSKDIAVDFLKTHTQADGILSTRPSLLKRGKELGFYTILRFFLLDSMSYQNVSKQLANAKPDMLEILPGLMPKIISRVAKNSKVPVIAGGLISDREDVMNALSAGAIAVSSTNPSVWNM